MLKTSSTPYSENVKMKSSASALNFINNIDIDDLEYFMYDDNLGNFTDLFSEVGKCQVSVKKSCYDLTRCIKVQIENEILISEMLCQTKIVCYIGQNLVTLYETFEEILRIPGYKMTKNVLIKNIGKGFEITKKFVENDVEEHLSKFISKQWMKGYISEGASVLLHRLLVARGIPDDLSVMAFNQYWELSCASYKKLKDLKLPINNEKVDVSGIERIVYSASDYETVWQMYFVPDGHLMSKAQVGSPISAKVKELTEYVEKDSFLSKPAFKMTELLWQDDVQLISQFLDMKVSY